MKEVIKRLEEENKILKERLIEIKEEADSYKKNTILRIGFKRRSRFGLSG